MKDSSARPADGIEQAVSSYGSMLYRLCLVMLGNESDAEDTVQETFIKYLRKSPDFRNPEHEKAWLLAVASNGCRDLLRRRKRQQQYMAAGSGMVNGAEPAYIQKPPSDLPDSGILEALMALPEKFRLVLILYYVEERSVGEIARIIGRTPSAVKMRLKKGRKLLEEEYRKEYR